MRGLTAKHLFGRGHRLVVSISRFIENTLSQADTGLKVLATIVSLLFAAPTLATIDQSNLATPTGSYIFIQGDRTFGQTFPIAVDGTLNSVSIRLQAPFPSADIIGEIQGVAGGVPDGNVLASATVPASAVFEGLNVFDFSAARLSVVSGQQYAMVLRSPAAVFGYRISSVVNEYSGGQATIQVDAASAWTLVSSGTADAIFQTDVEPGASCTLVANDDEVIANFDLRRLDPQPPYTNITFQANFSSADPVDPADDVENFVYGDLNGGDLLQVRVVSDGAVYGPLTTANPLFDPMLDGVFSLGFRAATGSAILESVTVSGSEGASTTPDVTVVPCLPVVEELVELRWEARVDVVNVSSGVSPFTDAAVGDLITGSFVYDVANAGTITGTGVTEYTDAIVEATAQVGSDTLVAGASWQNFVAVADALPSFTDQYNWLRGDIALETGSNNGVPAAVILQAIFEEPESDDVIASSDIPISAPQLGRFGAGSSIAVRLQVGGPSGNIATIGATLLAVQSSPYVDIDRDGDGISNDVELELGLDPDNPADALFDLDSDGINNIREVRNGSRANDASSMPRQGLFRIDVAAVWIDEGDGFIPVDVTRFAGDQGFAQVQLDTLGGSAVPGTDYQPWSEVLFWADGESGTQRVNIPLIDNVGLDFQRTVAYQLSGNTPGTEIAVRDGLAVIVNDDFPDQGVPFGGFIDVVEFVDRSNEADPYIEFLINRRGSTVGRVGVNYSDLVGDSNSGVEFAYKGSVVWEDGDASIKSVRIPTNDDLVQSPLVRLPRLDSTTGAAVLGSLNITFVDTEDEELLQQADTVGFAARRARFDESTGEIRIPVIRIGEDPASPLSVEFSLDAEAVAAPADPGVDFDASGFPQTLTWASGEQGVRELVIPTFDDDEAELTEFLPFLRYDPGLLPSGVVSRTPPNFNMALYGFEDTDSNLDRDGDGVPDVADLDRDGDGVINNLDRLPLDPNDSEDGDSDGIGDSVDSDRDGDGIGDAVEAVLGLDATDPDDAAATDGDSDSFSDLQEVTAGSDPDDPASVPGSGFIEFSTLNSVVSEDSGELLIRLNRVRGNVGELSVSILVEPVTAVEGTDYEAINTTLTWPDGSMLPVSGQFVQTPDIVRIPLIDNSLVDGDRVFRVRALPAGTTTSDQIMVDEALVQILDDDFDAQNAPFGGLISVAATDVRVRESSGVAAIMVDRRGSFDGSLFVSYGINPDSATPDLDYVPVSGTLVWGDGDTTPQWILVPIIDDLEIESTEGFGVFLAIESGDGVIEYEEAFVQLVDDELVQVPDLVTTAQLEPIFNEVEGEGVISLFRLGDGSGGATVQLDFVDFGASNGTDPLNDDYNISNQSVEWLDGETGRIDVRVPLFDDDVFEDLEGFDVLLTSVFGGVLVDNTEPIGATIADPEDQDLLSDSDFDGLVDFADLDDDNDGVNDFADEFPLDGTRAGDRDGDGVDDLDDAFPDNPNVSSDDLFDVTFSEKLFGLTPGTDTVETDDSDRFGISIDTIPGRLAIGARQAISGDGAVYVYEPIDNTATPDPDDVLWEQSARVTAEDPSLSYFGSSVSLQGDQMLVGAWLDNDRGSAYRFFFDPSDGWIQGDKLLSSAAQVNENFGVSVALLDDQAIVGAPGNSSLGVDAGAVYVFKPDLTGAWVETQVLTAGDGAAGHQFGLSVVSDGTVLLVGAPGADGFTDGGSGAVYVFFNDGFGNWIQSYKIEAPDGEAGDAFGVSVALDDDVLFVGAQSDDGTGSVYVFDRLARFSFNFQQKLENPDAVPDASYGRGISVKGNTAIVGAPFGAPGTAYIYGFDGSWWELQDQVQSDTGQSFDWFGFAAAVGESLFVGDREDNDNGFGAGAVHVYDTSLVDSDGDGIADINDTDDDNDGIPDEAEQQADGLTELDPADALLDADDDGVNNLREYLAGTLLDDPSSTPDAGYVSLVYRAYNADEADSFVRVEVRRLLGDVGEISVDLITVDGSAEAGLDYEPVSETLTWLDGDLTPRFVDIPLIDDGANIPGVILTAELANPQGGARLFDDQAHILIANDEVGDTPAGFAGVVRLGSVFGLVTEASGQATIWINRDLSSAGTASVDYEITTFNGQTGVESVGAVLAAGTISWADGESQALPVTVDLIDDGSAEATEFVGITLSNPSTGLELQSGGAYQLQIFDEDRLRTASVTGAVNRYTTTEEQSGSLPLRLFRLGDDSVAAGIDAIFIQTSNSRTDEATLGVDYDGTIQSVTWGAGESNVQELSVPIFQDEEAEGEFLVTFLSGANADPVSIGLIFDFADSDLFTDTDGDGFADGVDYDSDDDGVPNLNDRFPLDDQESADLDGDGIGDNADTDTDGDGIGDQRELALGLDPLDPVDGFGDQDLDGVSDVTEVRAGSDPLDAASVPGTGFVELGDTNIVVGENAATLLVDVYRVRGSQGELSVLVTTTDATALAGVDYTAVATPVIWADGDMTPRQVAISIADNEIADGLRSFDIRVMPSGLTLDRQITVNRSTVLIEDDDVDAQGAVFGGLFDISAIETRAPESQNRISVSVTRRGSDEGTVTVDYSLSPTSATPGVDYVDVSGTLIWADGDSTPRTVVIPIIDDDEIESSETISFSLSNPTGGSGLSTSVGTLTIVDEEIVREPSAIGLAQIVNPVRETDGVAATISLVRLGSPDGDIPASVTFPPFGSEPGIDFDDSTLDVVFPEGETGRLDITFEMFDDAVFELEFIRFSLVPDAPGPFLDNAGFANGVIYDDEDQDVTTDSDFDGIPDRFDGDRDNDNVANVNDAFPDDPTRVGDSDGDGVDDLDDAFPDDPTLSSDAIADIIQLDKLRAGDGAAEDRFGGSVAVDGETAAVGAFLDDHSGVLDAGSAYVFELNSQFAVCPESGSVDSWCEQAKLTLPFPAEQDLFGFVDIEAGTIVVTASRPTGQASAHVFERDISPTECTALGLTQLPTTDPWCRTADISPSTGASGDLFGSRAASLSGDTFAVGAEGDDTAGIDAGAVYIFERNSTGSICLATGSVDPWCETRIFPDDFAAGDRFGHGVSLDGDRLIVSADRDGDNGESSGSVYVFERNADQVACPVTGFVEPWCQRAKLLADDGQPFDRFGRSVSLAGDTIVVGAPIAGNVDGIFSSGRGVAYIFRNTGGDSWQQVDRIEPRGGAGYGDIFGYPAFDGTTAVVGSPSDDIGANGTGSAYVFQDTGGDSWQQQAKLVAPDAAEFDGFGDENAAVSGDAILVGASGDDDLGDNSGSVYVFNITSVDADGDDIADDVDRDDDNDGIADSIENQFSFLNRVDPDDADLDFDLDGISNVREVLAGYRPDDAGSVPDAGYISFTHPYRATEEIDGPITLEVRRLRGAVGAVSVNVNTFDGSALAGTDYEALSTTLSWADGDMSAREITITITPTPTDQRGGVFGVSLTPVADERIWINEARVLVNEADIEFTGIDYDGFLGASSNGTRIVESSGGALIWVNRSDSDVGEVSVDYELVPVSGVPATVGVDYEALSGTLTWPDGDRAPRPLFVRVFDDAEAEATESMQLLLTNNTGATSLSQFNQFVHIVDDEIVQSPSAIGATFLTYHEETDAAVELRFVRTGNGVGAVDLGIGFTGTPDPTATVGDDFTDVTGTVSWLDGETGIQTLSVPLLDDDFLDNPLVFESLPVSLPSLDGAIYADWYWPNPIIFDIEDLDFVTDTDGDGALDIYDLDDDNDLLADSDDPTPQGEPLGAGIDDVETIEDGSGGSIDLEAAFAPTVATTYSVVSVSNSDLFESISITGSTLDFTLATNQSGIADIVVQADSVDGDSSQDQFSIAVDPVVDAPLLSVAPQSGISGLPIPLNIDASLTDIDGSETLSVSIEPVPIQYELSAGVEDSPGIWIVPDVSVAGLNLLPIAPFTGGFELTVAAVATELETGDTASETALLEVSVEDVVDVDPIAVDDDLGSLLVGSTNTGIDILGNDTNLVNAPVTAAIASAPALGTASIAADNTLTYVAPADAAGDDFFDYTVTDAEGDSSTATVTLFVNDLPLAVDDEIETTVDTPVETDVLVNDSGLLNGLADVSIVSQPANGTLIVTPDNTIIYTPDSGFAGTDTGVYAIEDSDGDIATANLALFSDAFPDAVADDAGETVIGTPILNIDVIANDTGLDNGPVEVTAELVPNAIVSVNDDNTLNYLPNSGFSGSDSFLYRVTDADGDFSIGLVNTQVSSASGIPSANVNLVGPTPDDPLYYPDTGLRQQNEVQCAFQSDNLLRMMCVYNDWRAVELNGDGSIGASMTRDQSSWFSRLAPNHNQYEEILGLSPSSDIDPDLGFAADPVIASVPGGMLTGFIASFRDERRGTGGLYMQRWYEQNSEIGYPFEPQQELITVDEGEPGLFLDKDHMIFNINQTTPDDTETVSGTLENGETITREWPAGEVSFVYSEFIGSDGQLIDFEELAPGSVEPVSGIAVIGDVDNVEIAQAPLVDSLSLSIDTVGLTEPTSVTLPDVLPFAAERSSQIALQFLLFAPDEAATGSFAVETPYGSFEIGNGFVSTGGVSQPVTASLFQLITLFADTINGRFNLSVDGVVFADVPFDSPTSSDVVITAPAAGDVQLFVEAIGVSVATDSNILVTQSSDFGQSWSEPVTLTPADEGVAAHQGAYLAAFGDEMLAVWRRIDDELNPDPAQSDAILYARSTDRGQTWSETQVVRDNICPFDQTSQSDRFRTLTFPVAVGSSSGFQVFWSDRDYAGGSCETGPARVVMTTLGAGGSWSTPMVIDPVTDTPQRLGHQFMPAVNVSQDQIQVAWYDSRNDESRSYTDQINDAAGESEGTVLLRRHTLDVRSVRIIGGVPVEGSIQVTQFQQGVTEEDPTTLIQLERFYANGRIFQQGQTPFLGDYIGVAARAHRFNAVTGTWESNQTFDPEVIQEPLFFVSWADNRDVRGDVWEDLVQPTEYTPGAVEDEMVFVDPESTSEATEPEQLLATDETGDSESPGMAVPGDERYDDTLAIHAGEPADNTEDAAASPAAGLEDSADSAGMCIPGLPETEYLGLTRNQNVYGSMIRPGFQLSVPTPSKPIDEFQRGYVLYLQNFTSQARRYSVEIINQPEDGRASFRQVEAESDEPLTVIDVLLTPRSSSARTVFITSDSADPDAELDQRVNIEVLEQDCAADCQQQLVTLNNSTLGGEFDNPGLQFPGLQFDALEAEVRAPVIAAPIVTPGLQFPGLQFPGLQFPGLQFPGLQFPGLQFPGLQFPGLQFPGLQFPGLQFPGLQFPGLQFDPESDEPRPVSFNQTVDVPDGGTRDSVENAELVGRIEGLEMTQIVWPVTNEGNVIGSFDLEPFVNADITGNPSQILVVRSYVQNTLIDCSLVPFVRQEVIVNIADPELAGEDSGINVFIAPGETLLVMLRVWQPIQEPGMPDPEPFSMVDEDNAAIAVMAEACDSNTLDVCDPESEDPAAMPPMATVGAHPVEAEFAAVDPAIISVSVGGLGRNRVTRQTYADITVTNVSTESVIGQLRAVLDTNKLPEEVDGQTDELNPRPFLTILENNNSVLRSGESVTRRVIFDSRRPRPVFSVDLFLKSVTPP